MVLLNSFFSFLHLTDSSEVSFKTSLYIFTTDPNLKTNIHVVFSFL